MLLLQKELERVTAGFTKERQQFQARIAAGEKAKRSLEVLCVRVVTTCVYICVSEHAFSEYFLSWLIFNYTYYLCILYVYIQVYVLIV